MHVWVNESYVLFDLFFKNKSSLDILCLLKKMILQSSFFFLIRICLNQIDACWKPRSQVLSRVLIWMYILQLIENDFKDCLVLCCTWDKTNSTQMHGFKFFF